MRPKGYKLCNSPLHEGKRWLPVSYFHVKRKDSEGEALGLQSACKTCAKIKSKEDRRGHKYPYQIKLSAERAERMALRKQQATVRKKERRRRQNRVSYRERKDPRLPFAPFQQWLQSKKTGGITQGMIARHINIDETRVRTILRGTYYSSRTKTWYPIVHVRYSTVEKFMMAYDETPAMIYSDALLSTYRATFHDSRRKF